MSDIFTHEKEDGHHDLWRRTIMKFYNRVLGDRDYTLFEVVRTGLRLPPILSSFGTVENLSLSSWRTLRRPAATSGADDEDELVVSANKVDVFNLRASLPRPPSIADTGSGRHLVLRFLQAVLLPPQEVTSSTPGEICLRFGHWVPSTGGAKSRRSRLLCATNPVRLHAVQWSGGLRVHRCSREP